MGDYRNYNRSKDLKHRHRCEIFVKEKEGKNGSIYFEGYHPSVGKVIVFTGFRGEKGYVGKVCLTANNLYK